MLCTGAPLLALLLALWWRLSALLFFFFFNDTATTEIYTLSLHDALPICRFASAGHDRLRHLCTLRPVSAKRRHRSEEHTSELQSRGHLVCRLLLEKKKKIQIQPTTTASTTYNDLYFTYHCTLLTKSADTR